MRKLLAIASILFFSVTLCFAFSDTANYEFEDSVSELSKEGILSGYSDGTFRPDSKITRAEFIKVVVATTGNTPAGGDCFNDVGEEWFAKYVCYAKTSGWVKGHSDGNFLPNDEITLIEALKILVSAFDIETIDPVGAEWYSASLETLAGQNAIPDTLHYYSEDLTRGETAELVWRIKEDKDELSATTLDEFKGPICNDSQAESYDNIDMDKVRSTWLTWYNSARADNGLSAYVYNVQLDRTAFIWSDYSRSRGYIDHKRVGQTAYYDYYMIEDWFRDLGLTFENDNRVTFTENIGRGPYSCEATDCTDELISSIKYTFDYYMNEVNSSYRPHYNSIMNAYFKEVGFGIVLSDDQYYLTVHYATAITSDPAPICD